VPREGALVSPLAAALRTLSDKEAEVIWKALGQWVENGQCNDSTEDPYEAEPTLTEGEALLDRMNAAMASLA